MATKKKAERGAFCVAGLNGAINYVRQFADDKALTGDYFQVRISGSNFECGTHEWGGDVDLPDSPFDFDFALNVYELSDYLRALPQNAALSTAEDGGMLAIKCGRATKRFAVYPKMETGRQKGVNGQWTELPKSFNQTLVALGRQKLRDKPTLISDGGLLFYRDNAMNTMLIAEDTGLPDFKMAQKFVAMVESFEPTKIAIDTNRVGFASEDRRMFVPLTVSTAPPVDKLLKKVRENIARDAATLTLDLPSLNEAYKVLLTEAPGGGEAFFTIDANGTNVTMSCNMTQYVVDGVSDKPINVTVARTALWNMAGAGLDFDGKLCISVPSTNDVIYVRKGNLTQISSIQRKIG